MAWDPATDVGGGVDGYSVAWDACTPDRVKDVEESVTTVSKQISTSGARNFSVRAVDTWGNWGNPACLQVNVDADRPTSSVAPLPGEQTRNWWLVAWAGSDGHSGIAHYDVQYKMGPGGPWTDWRVDTATTQGLFVHAIPGQFYAFRCRAVDWVGNVEGWPVLGEAEVADTGTLAGADTSGLSEMHLPIVAKNQ
jgi:predicted phage tail protein